MRCRIGITLGDPAGIGPEIVRGRARFRPAAALTRSTRSLATSLECSLGQPTPETARAALDALEEGAQLALRGEIDAIVTGPIHKARMYEIGFEFPGQTEFFADRCGVKNFAMLLTGGKLTVALVTTHIPLREVSANIAERTRSSASACSWKTFFGAAAWPRPRIAVAGLNPHAGESGAHRKRRNGNHRSRHRSNCNRQFDQSQSSNLRRSVFARHHLPPRREWRWDGVLCMYHDQGLIPLKLHAFHEGVNVTLGLPFPRTSPDHGTAFEIAGKESRGPTA